MRHDARAAGTPDRSRARPFWTDVLRALREARGVTQDGWATWLGVSRKTVQRGEGGVAVPDLVAEDALVEVCRQRGLFRPFDHGPLRGLTLTTEPAARLGGAPAAAPLAAVGPSPARLIARVGDGRATTYPLRAVSR
jgi:DNA-binding XRE family transcriptional regulator